VTSNAVEAVADALPGYEVTVAPATVYAGGPEATCS